jgi:hypothetical protein
MEIAVALCLSISLVSPWPKEPEDILQEEWYNIPLETVQTCMSPFQQGLQLY